ncbi:MAG: hypothetical protein GXY28_11465 [Bacteriovoracaceae bacterium]|nr:hypothetical protein [Bacteriovoracaceae bacterium]HPX51587.1 hypothetical protein [Deltaproteobacteria bacterium]HQA71731.1 hypothetical protein [Deltaproteobacteria bacterium]HRR20388.1 hypothetical protein [Desulfomonilia bacterium]HRR67965.1 hypothetical protein [Desulfomonilia bacterium]
MQNEDIAIDVLKTIAMDSSRVLVERQRAIDALTLFRESSIPALTFIERKTDMNVLKERCALYIRRIREGAAISMTL